MLGHPKTADRLSLLAGQLCLTEAVTPDLVSRVIDQVCVRLASLHRPENIARLTRLIEASAWTEVALALIELDLPQWTLRRLVHDGGEWLCSLSKQPNLPVEFDDTVDAGHEILSLALLSAFLEAKRQVSGAREVISPREPQITMATAYVSCCDNFA